MWQTASDFIIFLGWLFENLGNLITQILTPVKYIFTFVKSFFLNAFAPPVASTEIWHFPLEIIEVFNAIPFWAEMMTALATGLLLIFAYNIIKHFLKT